MWFPSFGRGRKTVQQPDEPRPGWTEKDQPENELHAEVCASKMPLADAQHCIASNWVECWEKKA